MVFLCLGVKTASFLEGFGGLCADSVTVHAGCCIIPQSSTKMGLWHFISFTEGQGHGEDDMGTQEPHSWTSNVSFLIFFPRDPLPAIPLLLQPMASAGPVCIPVNECSCRASACLIQTPTPPAPGETPVSPSLLVYNQSLNSIIILGLALHQ